MSSVYRPTLAAPLHRARWDSASWAAFMFSSRPCYASSAAHARSLSEVQAACRRSPCDHARALHYGEPCQQMVGVVVAANPEQIVEPAEADVAAGEGL